MSGSIWDVVWWHPTYGIGNQDDRLCDCDAPPIGPCRRAHVCAEAFQRAARVGNGDARRAFYQRLTEALAQQGLTEHVVRAGQDTVMLGDCSLKVLNPFSPPMQRPASSRRLEGHRLNNRSVVTQLTAAPTR